VAVAVVAVDGRTDGRTANNLDAAGGRPKPPHHRCPPPFPSPPPPTPPPPSLRPFVSELLPRLARPSSRPPSRRQPVGARSFESVLGSAAAPEAQPGNLLSGGGSLHMFENVYSPNSGSKQTKIQR